MEPDPGWCQAGPAVGLDEGGGHLEDVFHRVRCGPGHASWPGSRRRLGAGRSRAKLAGRTR